jgi:hypothetical protein
MIKLLSLLTAFWLISLVSRAQSFRFRASVDAVQQSGFHRILLPPDVLGRLNSNLTDIRLYDNQEQEVPYLLTRQQPTLTAPFIDYEIISQKSQPNVATTLIIRNQTNDRINSLGIILKNTNVGKKARLSGSADARNWYAIDNAIWLGPAQTSQNTTDTKLLHFPLSDYGYYRLEINDSLSAPLNILKVGNYRPTTIAGTYSVITDLRISQRDSSDKHTYIHLTRNNPARFDKLTLWIPSAIPFRRRAEVGLFVIQRSKRGRKTSRFEVAHSFDLRTADSNVVYLPGMKAKELYIVIANKDSPPLPVGNVRAYQLTAYLLANLTADKAYHVGFSSDNIPAPAYDLTPFRANLPTNLPIIGTNRVTNYLVTDYTGVILRPGNLLIWLALGIVLIVLGFLSYRMLRDMGKLPS